MVATLYNAGKASQHPLTDGLALPRSVSAYAQATDCEAHLLGCSTELVDVLATGPGYVAYSIFDYEGGPANLQAMEALNELSGQEFAPEDEDMQLFGPVLIVTAK